jgi:hypothetical protein
VIGHSGKIDRSGPSKAAKTVARRDVLRIEDSRRGGKMADLHPGKIAAAGADRGARPGAALAVQLRTAIAAVSPSRRRIAARAEPSPGRRLSAAANGGAFRVHKAMEPGKCRFGAVPPGLASIGRRFRLARVVRRKLEDSRNGDLSDRAASLLPVLREKNLALALGPQSPPAGASATVGAAPRERDAALGKDQTAEELAVPRAEPALRRGAKQALLPVPGRPADS